MFQVLRARMGKRDEGFSLIELMIVVLIIAILIAIAIPTFLGARSKSQDRAAQVDLRQALLTAKGYYTDNETYDADVADLTALEPTLEFVAMTDATADGGEVGFLGGSTTVVFAKASKSGAWFCIAEDVPTGTTFGRGTALSEVDSAAECADASW